MQIKHFITKQHDFITNGIDIYYSNISSKLPNNIKKCYVTYPSKIASISTPINIATQYLKSRSGINHFFDLKMGIYGKLHPTNSVITLYDTIIQDYHLNYGRISLYERYLNEFDKIITCSHSSKSMISNSFGIPEYKINVIHAGVDTSKYKPCDESTRLYYRKKYLLPDNAIIISTVGNMSSHKNVSFLIDVIRELTYSHDEVYLLKGGYYNQEFSASHYGELLHKSKLYGVYNNIRWIHNISDVSPLYHASDVYVSPSMLEGFNMPLLEAMACGTPVVASNTSSHPEVVGTAGTLVDFNVNEWVDAILKARDYREQTKTKCIDHASTFTWESSAEKLMTVYKTFE